MSLLLCLVFFCFAAMLHYCCYYCFDATPLLTSSSLLLIGLSLLPTTFVASRLLLLLLLFSAPISCRYICDCSDSTALLVHFSPYSCTASAVPQPSWNISYFCSVLPLSLCLSSSLSSSVTTLQLPSSLLLLHYILQCYACGYFLSSYYFSASTATGHFLFCYSFSALCTTADTSLPLFQLLLL